MLNAGAACRIRGRPGCGIARVRYAFNLKEPTNLLAFVPLTPPYSCQSLGGSCIERYRFAPGLTECMHCRHCPPRSLL